MSEPPMNSTRNNGPHFLDGGAISGQQNRRGSIQAGENHLCLDFADGFRRTVQWYRSNPGWWQPLIKRLAIDESAWK